MAEEKSRFGPWGVSRTSPINASLYCRTASREKDAEPLLVRLQAKNWSREVR